MKQGQWLLAVSLAELVSLQTLEQLQHLWDAGRLWGSRSQESGEEAAGLTLHVLPLPDDPVADLHRIHLPERDVLLVQLERFATVFLPLVHSPSFRGITEALHRSQDCARRTALVGLRS